MTNKNISKNWKPCVFLTEGVPGDSLHDHLLNFTRTVKGAYWFCAAGGGAGGMG